MKLSARDASGFLQRPDGSKQAGLIYGPDSDYVASKREELSKKILGKGVNDPFLMTELTVSSLKEGPSVLLDAMLARSMTGDKSLIVLRDATDGATKALDAALSIPEPDANFLLVTASNLAPKSSLRKLFEKLPNIVTLPVFAPDNQGAVIMQAFEKAGLPRPEADAIRDLEALSSMMSFGEAKQFAETLVLSALHLDRALNSDDIVDIAPAAQEDGMDRLAHLVSEGNLPEALAAFRRLIGQGTAAVPIILSITRHFRRLYQVMVSANAKGGVDRALQSLRPPVFGRNKMRLQSQLRQWDISRLENALVILLNADQDARGGGNQAGTSLPFESLERTLIRLAVLARRKA